MLSVTLILTLGLAGLTTFTLARPQNNLILTYKEKEGFARYFTDGTDAVFATFTSRGDLIDCDVGRLNGTVTVYQEAVSGRPDAAQYEVYDIKRIARQCRRYLRKMMRLTHTDKSEKVQRMKKRIDLHMGYPGTKWCMATKPTPDAPSKLTRDGKPADKCCRALHSCKQYIAASLLYHELFNYFSWDIYGCECVRKFRKCLKKTKNQIADEVGHIYFDILNVKCFKLESKRECKKWNAWHSRCEEHGDTKVAKLVETEAYREEKKAM